MNLRFLSIVVFVVVMAGCVSKNPYRNVQTDSKISQCEYKERDLTQRWETRDYWCIPQGSFYVK